MKATIAGLATGLMLAGAPAFADSWKDDSGQSWRAASVQQVRHGDDRWERRRSHERHYQPRAHQRDWDRHYHYYRQYQPAPRHRHYYRDHRYGYYAPDAYSSAPNVWFSWTVR